MFAFIIILSLSFSMVINSMIDLGEKNPNNFGPYNLNYTRFELCSGPQSKNLTSNSFTLCSEGKAFYCQVNLTFLVAARINEMKMVVYSQNGDKIGNQLWTYKMKNVCKHFTFEALVKTFFKSSNCFVNKGSYFQTVNCEQVSHTFFGTSFFYGKYFLKVIVNSKIGNLMRFFVGIVFTKK